MANRDEEDDEYEKEPHVRPPVYGGHGIDPTLPTYKIVMLGERSTGKTSLFAQFTYATRATTVVTPRTRTVMLDETKMNIEVWDVPGRSYKERESWAQEQSYPRAHGFIVTYSKVNEGGLDKALFFIRKVETYFAKEVMRPEIMLVGTHSDHPKDVHKIDWLMAREFADRHNCLLIETKRWDGERVNLIFGAFIAHLHEVYQLVGRSYEIPEDEDDILQRLEGAGPGRGTTEPRASLPRLLSELPPPKKSKKELDEEAEEERVRDVIQRYGKLSVPRIDPSDRSCDYKDVLPKCWLIDTP